MRTRSVDKLLFRLGLMVILLLALIAESGVTRAADSVYIDIAFDQTNVQIGRTPGLFILITNSSPDAIRATKFQCIADGTSIKGQSISQLPGTIAANGSFRTVQYYRAVSAGTTSVHCELTATDLVTGATITVSSPSSQVIVISETRLWQEANSGTHVATVGQAVYINVVLSNRGTTPFTINDQSCIELGRSLIFTSKSPANTVPVLPGGQSQFIQYAGRAVSTGTVIIGCTVNATVSSGNTVMLFAPLINIVVK
jgi:hypothetical protein